MTDTDLHNTCFMVFLPSSRYNTLTTLHYTCFMVSLPSSRYNTLTTLHYTCFMVSLPSSQSNSTTYILFLHKACRYGPWLIMADQGEGALEMKVHLFHGVPTFPPIITHEKHADQGQGAKRTNLPPPPPLFEVGESRALRALGEPPPPPGEDTPGEASPPSLRAAAKLGSFSCLGSWSFCRDCMFSGMFRQSHQPSERGWY